MIAVHVMLPRIEECPAGPGRVSRVEGSMVAVHVTIA